MIDVWRPGDRPDFAGPLLIDTHLWIWYVEGVADRVTEDTRALMYRALADGGVLVSDISVWEIGTKVAKRKLTLMPTAGAWLDRATRRPGFSFLPLDRATLLASTELPGEIHGDPADRILIAAASLAAVPLATADPQIISYARSRRTFSVCDVRV
jgi:PIN domain nuclease of toxin-antitoxin system